MNTAHLALLRDIVDAGAAGLAFALIHALERPAVRELQELGLVDVRRIAGEARVVAYPQARLAFAAEAG